MGNRAPGDLEPCGTAAAYRRHLRHGEDVTLCPRCCEAESVRYTAGGASARRRERMSATWRERYVQARAERLSSQDARNYSQGTAASVQEWRNRRDA